MLQTLYYFAKRDKELVVGGSAFLEVRHQVFERLRSTEREFGEQKCTCLEVRLKHKLSKIAHVETMNNELESDSSLLGLKIDPYRKA